MRHSIDSYVQSIANDNAKYINEGGYTSIADYIIGNAENGLGWYEFFDEDEPSEEQIEELKAYLEENYDYLPE